MTRFDLYIKNKMLSQLQVYQLNVAQELLLQKMVEETYNENLLYMDIESKVRHILKCYQEQFYQLQFQ